MWSNWNLHILIYFDWNLKFHNIFFGWSTSQALIQWLFRPHRRFFALFYKNPSYNLPIGVKVLPKYTVHHYPHIDVAQVNGYIGMNIGLHCIIKYLNSTYIWNVLIFCWDGYIILIIAHRFKYALHDWRGLKVIWKVKVDVIWERKSEKIWYFD